MDDALKSRLRVFDPNEAFEVVVRRRLPHWSQDGTICFITWRTWDSIPAPILAAWLAERAAWLAKHGIDSTDGQWRRQLESLNSAQLQEFQLLHSDRWNEHLDACHGACVLRTPELARIVADSLRHFDGKRYDLTDFVVMPNHVHLLAAFPNAQEMLDQCESWKHFTAAQINRALGRKGRFWQQDGFDHLVRSAEQFDYYRRYIADNPARARLQGGEFLHWSKV